MFGSANTIKELKVMEYKIKGYKPESLFRFFEDISAIPRGSGNERAISDFLVNFAKIRGLEVYQDGASNVVIKKAASAGSEDKPPIMLQGHLDMVCEKKAGVAHDFDKDGIDLIVENGVLRANGTTLGGDNGAAVALMMAILDDDSLRHPPVECVFTTEEEVGLNGAVTLDKSILKARTMINLDSEEEGVATVSCAGGMRYTLSKTAKPETDNGSVVTISLSGLLGGHSGTDIDKERYNANKLMARLLYRLSQDSQARLVSFNGGTKDNAIPRECKAAVYFKDSPNANAALETANKMCSEFSEEIIPSEPGFQFEISVTENKKTSFFSYDDTKALIGAVCLAPNGIRRRNPKQGYFVVTSLNLGIVSTENDKMSLVFAPRSSVSSLQEETKDALKLLADTYGFETDIAGQYPGWAFKENSPIREVFCRTYKDLFNSELKIEAIHAGLECGLFSDAIPGLDAIAVGPTIRGCHTPDEYLPLDSFERFYKLLTAVLEQLA